MQKFKTILKKPFTIFLLITLLLFSSYQLGLYIDRPRDLGPEIQYIGKINHGCGGWLVYIATLFMCASPPNDYRYYFGTDMSLEEMKKYFKNAEYGIVEKDHPREVFLLKDSDEWFDPYFQSDDTYELDKSMVTEKKTIFRLTPYGYSVARKAL